MEIWQVAITAAITTLVGTLVGIAITDLVVRIKAGNKKVIDRKKEEQKQNIMEAVAEVVDPLMTPIQKELETVNKKVDQIVNEDLVILKKANRDAIRCQLYGIYDRCLVFKTKDDIDNESELFDSYKALKGNHGCDSRHNKFEALPTQEEYEYQQTHK